MERYYHVNGKRLEEQYAAYLSDFTTWDQAEHAEDYILFPKNIGPYLSIDETSLSQGELYTILTNKEAKSRKGSIVAIIKGTESEHVHSILKQIPQYQRHKVKEVTLDMAHAMQRIVAASFPKATQVTDRFHVQKLAFEGVQELRIKYRWEAIEQENLEMELAKEAGKKYVPQRLENGDSPKQLLARSRYLLFKSQDKWTPKQIHRAQILFEKYPLLKEAYLLARKLAYIYQNVKDKGVALTKLAKWYDEVEKSNISSFQTISRSIQQNYLTILNFFERRSTNANAESFNAKIKAFRTQFRGVRNVKFFLYRLAKIYA